MNPSANLRPGGPPAAASGSGGARPRRPVAVRVNGRTVDAVVEPRLSLLDFLRDVAGQTSVHVGCEHGSCGACTVLLDGEAARSCICLAVQADGAEVTTLEGITPRDGLHPVQRAFWEEHALQCGYCTPGMILAVVDLLRRNPDPSDGQIREAIGGNLCRCTGYVQVVRAARRAAAYLRAAGPELAPGAPPAAGAPPEPGGGR